jgi:hypothetical protein
MIIAGYVGRSIISRTIQLMQRTGLEGISHIAIDTEGEGIYEAWHIGGVRRIESLGCGHTPGTVVHRWHWPMMDGQERQAIAFLRAQVGKDYDYLGVIGFLSLRKRDRAQHRWFCSELAVAAGLSCGAPLLVAPPHHVMPQQVVWSPALRRIASVITTADAQYDLPLMTTAGGHLVAGP